MPIELAAPNPDWGRSFHHARDELLEHLGRGRFRAVEHIGSTSVQDLPAKPIIDMTAGVDDISDADAWQSALAQLGYLPWFGAEGRRSFERRDSAGRATHHLHIVVFDGPIWRDQMAFRDQLRASDADRAAYAQLKQELAKRFDDTREYSAAKTDFVQAVIARSKQVGELRREATAMGEQVNGESNER